MASVKAKKFRSRFSKKFERMTADESKFFIDTFFETIEEIIEEGSSVTFEGYMKFGLKELKPRKNYNINNNRVAVVPGKIKPYVELSDVFVKRLEKIIE